MYFRFEINNKEIRVWNWDDDFHTEVTVYDNKSYDRTIRKDEKGRFFTWDKQKVYLDTYKTYSLEELMNKINNKEFVTDDDLCQTILKEGVENIILNCPLNPISMIVEEMGICLCDGGKYIYTDCVIDEKRYKISDHYKLGVRALEENKFGTDSYYISDLFSLIKSGKIKIKKKILEVI
jgi:hypothetical protein